MGTPSRPHWLVGSLTIGALLHAGPVAADGKAIELFLGAAHSFDTQLTISQADEPDLELSACYATHAFEFPLYYSLRFGLGTGDSGAWELQLTHHKIHLENPPPEVERFEITHGFNLLTLNRSFARLPVTLRIGAGVVVAHPESVVRGRGFANEGGLLGAGYHLTGPALLVGASRRFSLSSRVFLVLEGQLTAARAKVPVADGEASAPNLAVHGLFGLGFSF